MDIEPSPASLFLPASETTVTISENQTSLFGSSCSLAQNHHTGHYLRLINHSLVLEHQQQLTMVLHLSFEVKFEVLRENDVLDVSIQKNVASAKIGIRLYNEREVSLRLFFSNGAAEAWSMLLEKRLNQKGFHEMFKPIRKLGKGNFATVYQAERMTDKVRFAVKAFSKQNSYSAKNGKESLINQLAVLRQLNTQPHPNVLKLEAVFESDNSIYVVLELLPGQTLFQAIQERKGNFSKEEVKTITSGVLAGLRHIHGHRIMHRDLKPENIMLRGSALEPVIVDFGLASNVDLKEYLFFRCGTPGYVAPEIIKLSQSEHVEPGCDIFSLGAIFHILLVRKPLFQGTRYEQVYRNNKQFNIRLDGEHFKEVERSALQLLGQMLDLNPSSRIGANDSLNHPYFVGESEIYPLSEAVILSPKVSSPVTESGSSEKKQKRKKLFLFF